MLISARIQALAPGRSSFFRLTAPSYDGTIKVFPAEEGHYYRVGDSPYGVPLGRYSINFYDEDLKPMTHTEQLIVIDHLDETNRAGPSQLSLHVASSKPGLSTPPLNANATQVAVSPRTVAPKGSGQPAPALGEAIPDHIKEADTEFRKYLHAMDLEDRQQDFIKNSAYVTEVAELFALNRIMRREMMELQRIIVLSSQQSYKDTEHVKGTIHQLLQLQKEVLTHAAEHISRPPAPPPDYVGLGHSALSMIREIGVALIARSQGKEVARSLPATAPLPQLPAKGAEGSEPAKSPPPDIIDRMVQKLKNASDVDLALAMSSPEKWKALFHEFTTANKDATSVPPADGAPTKDPREGSK